MGIIIGPAKGKAVSISKVGLGIECVVKLRCKEVIIYAMEGWVMIKNIVFDNFYHFELIFKGRIPHLYKSAI